MSGLAGLLPYFRPYRGRTALGVLAILGSAGLGLAAPLILGSAVDAFRESLTARGLAFYAALLVGVTLVQGVFNFTQRFVLVSVSRGIENDLRNDYFEHLERMEQGFFHQRAIGDLMARGTNDLQAVRMICGPAIMYSANTLFTGLGCLFFMSRIHAPLTLVALGTMPLVAIATKVVGQEIHKLFERVQEQFAAVTTRVQENLAGVRVVRAYAREKSEARRFSELNREYVERNKKLIRWSAAFHPLLQVLVGFGFVAVLWYGGTLVSRGAVTVGEFVSFNFFLGKLIWPMIAIGWVMNLVQRGRASLARINEVLGTEPLIRDEEPLVSLERVRGELAFRGLGFSYDGGGAEPALADIDLEVAAGRTIAVVGRTGAGKSTLLATIPRLVDPPPGTVFLDGVDVRRLPLAVLRDAIAMVPQETFLFSVSLRDNIAMGRPGAGDEEVLRAARDAGLAADLEQFPAGLDTIVGERGITLSGGQKQRVALARALARDPRILLLDDCLSAVDTHTEEEILGHLRQVFRGRTVLLVSHRVSTVRDADEILVMERGRVVARGPHEHLIAAGGLYAELARRQRLEDELAAV